MCVQEGGIFDLTHPGFKDFDEDCLTINIYAPAVSSFETSAHMTSDIDYRWQIWLTINLNILTWHIYFYVCLYIDNRFCIYI